MKQTAKINFLAISFLTFSLIGGSQDDTIWLQESTEQYSYHKSEKNFPADEKINAQPTIKILEHPFDSGVTRIKISHEIKNDGSVLVTKETWITKNPSYVTWKNGALLLGVAGISSLVIIHQDSIKDWFSPVKPSQTTVQTVTTDKPVVEQTTKEELENKENTIEPKIEILVVDPVSAPEIKLVDTPIISSDKQIEQVPVNSAIEALLVAQKQTETVTEENKSVDTTTNTDTKKTELPIANSSESTSSLNNTTLTSTAATTKVTSTSDASEKETQAVVPGEIAPTGFVYPYWSPLASANNIEVKAPDAATTQSEKEARTE